MPPPREVSAFLPSPGALLLSRSKCAHQAGPGGKLGVQSSTGSASCLWSASGVAGQSDTGTGSRGRGGGWGWGEGFLEGGGGGGGGGGGEGFLEGAGFLQAGRY